MSEVKQLNKNEFLTIEEAYKKYKKSIAHIVNRIIKRIPSVKHFSQDLLNDANLSFLKAYKKFEYQGKVCFHTYFWHTLTLELGSTYRLKNYIGKTSYKHISYKSIIEIDNPYCTVKLVNILVDISQKFEQEINFLSKDAQYVVKGILHKKGHDKIIHKETRRSVFLYLIQHKGWKQPKTNRILNEINEWFNTLC